MNPPRRPGRPSLDVDGTPSVQVSVRLTTQEFDALYRRASQERESMADVIRRQLRRGLAVEKDDPLK